MWKAINLNGVVIPFVSSPYCNLGSGLYMWTDKILNKRVIAAQLGRSLTIAGGAFSIVGDYNSYALYKGPWSGFEAYVYQTTYDSASGYGKLSAAPEYGLSEYLVVPDTGDEYYIGDQFWDAPAIFASQSGTITPRGVNKGDSSKIFNFSHDLPSSYWQEVGNSGIFEAQAAATGKRYVGRLVLQDDQGNTYTEVTASTYGAKSSFSSTAAWGGISYSSSSWRIGSGDGYWEYSGDLPKSSDDGTATFSRVWNGGDDEDPYDFDLDLSFSSWSASPESKRVNVFAVAEYL